MMRRLALLALILLSARARAEFPLGDMAPDRLGLQYGFAFRGQDITSKDVPSHETIHALTLGYAPIPYLEVEGGIGLDRMVVDRYNGARFRGEYGLSPLFGATGATSNPIIISDLVKNPQGKAAQRIAKTVTIIPNTMDFSPGPAAPPTQNSL